MSAERATTRRYIWSQSFRYFLSLGHWPTLASAWLHFEVSFIVWALPGSLGILIAEELGLSPAEKGLLVAVPILGGAIFRIPLGLAADRCGPRKVGLAGLLIAAVPLFWGWLGARTYWELLCLGLLLGIAGASFAVDLPLASRWYPPEYQGLVIGVVSTANSGMPLSLFFAPRLAKAIGWHGVFGLALAPVLFALSVFALFARDAPHRLPSAGSSLGHLLGQSEIIHFCFLYAMTFGGFAGLGGFLPLFLHDQYQLSATAAANAAMLCLLGGSLLRPVGGFLADRLGGSWILLVLLGAASINALALAALLEFSLAAVTLFLLLAALGLSNGAVFQLVPQRFPNQIGQAAGVVGAAGGIGGFFLPAALGLLKDTTGSFAAGFLIFGLFLASGVVLLAGLLYRGSPFWRASRDRQRAGCPVVMLPAIWRFN